MFACSGGNHDHHSCMSLRLPDPVRFDIVRCNEVGHSDLVSRDSRFSWILNRRARKTLTILRLGESGPTPIDVFR